MTKMRNITGIWIEAKDACIIPVIPEVHRLQILVTETILVVVEDTEKHVSTMAQAPDTRWQKEITQKRKNFITEIAQRTNKQK